MLRILTGREGCGKTERIMTEIATGGKSVLIVPEQYSHETERLLCEKGGDAISLKAEVLNFTRLASRVFSLAGGLAVQYLDNCGRLLAMRLALKEASPGLRLFASVPSRTEHLSQMLAMIDELKNYGVSADVLAGTAEKTEGVLSQKLGELALLLEAYDAVALNGKADPTEKLKMLAWKLEECDYPEDKDFYIDCFSDLTKLEMDVLDRIIAGAKNVTVALTCDEDDIYALQRETIRHLKAAAARHGVACRVEHMAGCRVAQPEFAWLDRGLFNYACGGFEGSCRAIDISVSSDITEECHWAAARCRALMRQGVRWRDIHLAVTDMAAYEQRVERIFEKYGVPVYLSRKADIMKKPAVAAISAALEAVTGGYEYEDVFGYLKSGYGSLAAQDCDELENYVIRWNIRGGGWKSAWTYHPEGFGRDVRPETEQILERLNGLRLAAAGHLFALQARLESAEGCASMVEAVYEFLSAIDLPGKLESRASLLQAAGSAFLAEECGKLWEVIVDILDQCHAMLGDLAMPPNEFAKLLKLALSTGDIGTIPVYYDAVTVGDLAGMRHRSAGYLLVLGANDALLPSVPSSGGVISEDERAKLLELGVELAPAIAERTERELGVVHACLCGAGKGLTLSYPESGDGGEQLRPSMVVFRLRDLFPDIRAERSGFASLLWSPETAFEASFAEAAGDGGVESWITGDEMLSNRRERILDAAKAKSTDLSKKAAQDLYGRRLRLSSTRIDAFNACKFSYFMQYGLKAEARERAEFAAPEYGTFVHFVLENVCASVKAEGGFAGYDRGKLPGLVDELTRRYVETRLSGGLQNKSQRFIYLFNRLLKNVRAVIENVFDELSASDFQPLDFELTFGGDGRFEPVFVDAEAASGAISGKVDRVDGYVKDGKLYLRVVDYKTGKKSFDFTAIRYGMSLQMLIYLFALRDKGGGYYGMDVVPAGVLYMPARDEILKTARNVPPETLKKLRNEALTRTGLLLDDPDILNAMEKRDGPPVFLPFKLNKEGRPVGSSLASAEQLGKLAGYVDASLVKLVTDLGGGKTEPDPYKKGGDTPCQWCDYAAVCGHDNETFRYLRSYSAEKFWNELAEGGGDHA